MTCATDPDTVHLANIGDVCVVANPVSCVCYGLDPNTGDRLFVKFRDSGGAWRSVNFLYRGGDGADIHGFAQTNLHRLRVEVQRLARAGRLRV